MWFGYLREVLVLKQFLLAVRASEGTYANSCLPLEESEDAEGPIASPGMGNPAKRVDRSSWPVTSPSGFPSNVALTAVASRTRLAAGEADSSC